jgi:hypothetical protein
MLEVDWHEYRRLLRRHLPRQAPPWRDPPLKRLPAVRT